MTTFLLILLAVYMFIGLIVSIVFIIKEPLLLEAWYLLPIGALIFPYLLYVMITDSGRGRWI